MGRRRRWRRASWRWVVLVVILTSALCLWTVEFQIRPMVMALAEVRAALAATEIINAVVDEQVARAVDYRELFQVHTDETGRVVMIQANTPAINRIAYSTVLAVKQRLEAMKPWRVEVPLGAIFGSKLLATWGPRLPITLIPTGTVTADIKEYFEEAGINQTRHVVSVLVTVEIMVIVPFVRGEVTVSSTSPVASAVILGQVPSTYIEIGR